MKRTGGAEMEKNQLFILATAGVVTASAVAGGGLAAQAAEVPFSDVQEKNSHYEAIINLAERGIIHGYPDGTFKPNEAVTYAQAAKMIAGVIGMEGTGEELLQLSGILDNPAHINQPITRYKMAAIIAQTLQLPTSESVAMPFIDVEVAHQQAVAALFANHITKGTSTTTFSGNQFVTRGQLATFIVRAERASEHARSVNQVTGATITVQNIENGELVTDAQKWSIGTNAQPILNVKNAAALAGAKLDVIIVNGEITEVLAIDLNASGESNAHVVLDGGNASVGYIVVNADFIELKNITIEADLRVAGQTSYIALDGVNVYGEMFLQENETPKVASLTKVATNFFVTVTEINGSFINAIFVGSGAVINSNDSLPYINFISPSLEINVPHVGMVDMNPNMYPNQVLDGSAVIDLLSMNPDLMGAILDNLNKIRAENEQFLENLRSSMENSDMLNELGANIDMSNQLDALIASIMRTAQQQLPEERIREIVEQLAPNLSQQDKEKMQGVADSYVRDELQKLRLEELKKQQEARLQELENKKKQLEEENRRRAEELRARLQGKLKIDNVLLPEAANAGLVLGEGVEVGNITTDLPLDQLRQRIENRGQIRTITQANGQQLPFTPAVVDNSSSGSNTGGGSSGSGNTNPPLVITSLEAMIGNALEQLAEVKNGTIPISENGYDISYDQAWIPQRAVNTLEMAITEAQTMVTDAKRSPIANQRVASLTNMNLLVAVTQTDINNMVEKLEKLGNIQHIASGLQELVAIQQALDGEELMIYLDGEEPSVGIVYEAIWSILYDKFEEEQLATIFGLLEEMRNAIQITGDTVTFILNEAISYTDPVTQQTTELVPAIIAQLTIKQEVNSPTTIIINAIGAGKDDLELVLTCAESVPVELVDKMVEVTFDTTTIGGAISGIDGNQIFITLNAPSEGYPRAITLADYEFILQPIY